MKKITFLFLSMIVLSWMACENDPDTPDCLTLEQNPAWATGEAFKTAHTIQFPANYAGDGFTNNGDFFFHKYRSDDAAIFYWSLCGFASCEEYGFVSLATPLPESIAADDNLLVNNTDSGIGFYIQNDLTEYIEFCDDSEAVIAVFYYNTNATADGAFFLKLDDEQLHAALMVQYDSTQQAEVESILQTVL